MPKFTVEIDTDSKTAQVLMDGEVTNIQQFSASRYKDCYPGDDNVDNKYCTYFSVSQDDGKGSTSTYGLSFSDTGNVSESYSVNNYNMAKESAKIHKNAIAGAKLSKSLADKKPFKVINLETRSDDPHPEMLPGEEFWK